MSDHIFPPELALRALKSGPYKNTAYALAELLDNSADARAKAIGVALVVDDDRRQPHTIAVLDDGTGMDTEVLKHCVQYGYASMPDETAAPGQKRLGKFGVGLVAASFSQCSDLQVMSWQKGEAAANTVPSTRLSLSDDNRDMKANVLPEPTPTPLPEWASSAFTGMPLPISAMPHGTLVVWRDVTPDWKRAATLQDNLSNLCGRIHREFIQYRRLTIVVNVYNLTSGEVESPTTARPVDPTFLSNWNTEELAHHGFTHGTTLFQAYTGHPGDAGRDAAGDYEHQRINVPHGSSDKEATGFYILTCSYRSDRVTKDRALADQWAQPGDAPYGKLAKRLQGVSIMREGRELSLDPAWLRVSQTVDRWISVSIDFASSLDDVFGVSSDKQQARGLAELASMPLLEIEDEIKVLRRSQSSDDANYLERLYVAKNIKSRLASMQKLVRDQLKGTRPRAGGTETDPTVASTPELKQTGDRIANGERAIPMDSKSPASDPTATADAYENSRSGDELAREVRTPEVTKYGLKVDYALDRHGMRTEMFHIKLGNHMVVHFHERHPLSEAMAKLLAVDVEEDPSDEQHDTPTMQDALRVIRGLVVSFARALAEADEHDPREAAELKRSLTTWSGVASQVFAGTDD